MNFRRCYASESILSFFFSLAVQPPWALASAFQFYYHFTDGRTPWTSNQLVARPLPKHRATQTQNKHTPNIHALCGIRFRACEDSPLGYCDRPVLSCNDQIVITRSDDNLHLQKGIFKLFKVSGEYNMKTDNAKIKAQACRNKSLND
jgi:hypothetical protein